MGKLRVMSGRGDDETPWNPTDEQATAAARAKFDELTAKGYAGFRKVGRGPAEHVKAFDPQADEIILVGARAGG